MGCRRARGVRRREQGLRARGERHCAPARPPVGPHPWRRARAERARGAPRPAERSQGARERVNGTATSCQEVSGLWAIEAMQRERRTQRASSVGRQRQEGNGRRASVSQVRCEGWERFREADYVRMVCNVARRAES